MNDDFEKRLQQVAQRQIPPGWRQEILTAAKRDETSRQASTVARPNSLIVFMDQLAALLRPQRAAWVALAAVWIVIMLLNLSGGSDSTTSMTASIPAEQTRIALKQKQVLMLELAGRTEARETIQPRVIPPGPRSQRREEIKVA